jgi:catechol 2,3-dioxygenase-like lactoylglutathione lyase family enzyme
MDRPRMRVSAAVLGAADANALAAFYERLLGWTVVDDEPGWVRLRDPTGSPQSAGLSFAHEPRYVTPVWPSAPGEQQMMVHLDIAVDDLDEGVAWAIECGATPAQYQPQEQVRVMLDPAGHPFCLFSGSG